MNNLIENLNSFYDCAIFDENQKALPSDILIDGNIKNYILEKLAQKSVNYPECLNLNFQTPKEFERFNKNLIGEIYRLYLNIARAARNYRPLAKSKAEPLLKKAVLSYLELKGCFTTSLNAVVSQDGKKTELGDLIPATSWETYEEAGDRQLAFFEIEEGQTRIKAKNKKREKKGDYHDPLLF